MTIFWEVTPCSPIEIHRLFGGTYCLHLLDWEVSQARNRQEEISVIILSFYIYTCISLNSNGLYDDHKSPPSLIHWTQLKISHLFPEIHFNIIIPLFPSTPNCFLSWDFLPERFVYVFVSSMRATCLPHLIFFDFVIVIIFGELSKFWSYSSWMSSVILLLSVWYIPVPFS